jgi:phosphoglycolate phosphatase
MIRNTLCLFDLDGVLLDSETNISWLETSIKKTLNHFKIPITNINLKKFYIKNIQQFKQSCLNLGIDPDVFWPIRNNYYIDEKIKAMQQGLIKPFSDIKEIYHIKNQFQLGIISNSPQIIVDSFVDIFNFSDLFSINIGRGDTIWDIEHLKPDPYLYELVKTHTNADKIIYVGDRESDREFAIKTDMSYFHLDRFNNPSNGFNNLAEIIQTLKNI